MLHIAKFKWKKAGNLTGLDKNYEPKQSLGGTLTMDNDLEAEHQLDG